MQKMSHFWHFRDYSSRSKHNKTNDTIFLIYSLCSIHGYKPGDLRVELVENAVINIGLLRLSPREWPKVGRGTAYIAYIIAYIL